MLPRFSRNVVSFNDPENQPLRPTYKGISTVHTRPAMHGLMGAKREFSASVDQLTTTEMNFCAMHEKGDSESPRIRGQDPAVVGVRKPRG